jgi:hypothetical protein
LVGQSETIHQFCESLARHTKFLCGARTVAASSRQCGTNELRVERSSRSVKTGRPLPLDTVEVRRKR